MQRAMAVGRHIDRHWWIVLLAAFVALAPARSCPAGSEPTKHPASVLELEQDWSKDMWVVTGSMFFSGYPSIAAYLAATTPPTNPPPLNAESIRNTQDLRARARRHPDTIDPDARCHVCGDGCLPYGIPLALTMPDAFKFQFAPGMVIVLSKQGYRKISTSTRQHPKDLDPTYGGHSIGYWEGDTLVVDTVGMSDKTVIEPGLPHSDHLRVVEHWRQIERDRLENRIVISDPKVLTHDWTATRTYRRVIGREPQEKPCM
jgi:hypothetical protein